MGANSFPQTVGLVADVGLTSNSTVTLTHLMANQPEVVLFVGGNLHLSHCAPNLRAANVTSPAEEFALACMFSCENYVKRLAIFASRQIEL